MRTPVEVVTLAPSRRAHRARFLAVPAPLYHGDPRYVPPLRRDLHRLLDPSANPWHRHGEMVLFIAARGRETVGRIAAIRDRRNDEMQAERVGFFGFFDCVDDGACAAALLGAAERWARERGAVAMRGPISPSMDDECGCLVEGFDSPPVIQMPYNPPYYAGLLEAGGYRKEQDLLAYEFLPDQDVRPAISRVADAVLAGGNFRIRSVDLRRFQEEVETVRRLYNSAWERNWGFIPLDAIEFAWRAQSLKQIIDPRFALFVEARRGEAFEPVALGLAVPDVNEILIGLKGRLTPLALLRIVRGLRHVKAIRVLLLGVDAAYRKRGLEALLIREIHQRAGRAGIPRAELSWVLEDNVVMNRTIRKAGGRHYKTYRIFGKRLT
ncbi:MAG: N-acetyltransferase [Candidatus Rokuibacteriota bacterium]